MQDIKNKIEKIDERQRQLEIINTKLSLMIEIHENLISKTESRVKKLENRKSEAIDRVWWMAIASVVGIVVTEALSFMMR